MFVLSSCQNLPLVKFRELFACSVVTNPPIDVELTMIRRAAVIEVDLDVDFCARYFVLNGSFTDHFLHLYTDYKSGVKGCTFPIHLIVHPEL